MHEKLYSILVKRAVIIPTSEIYNPLAGFYDYGPVGTAIRQRIIALWREIFLKQDGFLEIDGASILPEQALKASGHVENFNDPLAECLACKRRFRADHLINEALGMDASHMSLAEMTEAIQQNGIKCPVCGAAKFGEVKPFNMMFRVDVGSVS
ncbi:MAG: glycine--tRNA ligase, partial [Candidatus Micrarchaeia archaeon]